MDGKYHDLQTMIRRALMAQAELGVGELVLKARRAADSRATAAAIEESSRVVTVQQALMAKHEKQEPVQDSLGISWNASYAGLAEHREAICNCHDCPLGETRNKFVYGTGSPHAEIMFVGEAPGADEDRLGEPFVGRAGQLLDKILAAMKLTRQEVYIANILKCRPPGNRDPQPDEMDKCFPHLREQIRLIKPKLLCALGRIAAQAMLKTTTPLGKLRGQWHEFENIPLIVTYHPAALLRFPEYKKGTWEDMQRLMARHEQMK